jgi:2-C-methyl-D-erythritol 4-phosphate cytidylyltransferase
MLSRAGCRPIVVVVPEDSFGIARSTLGEDVVLVSGGATRRDSIRSGLMLIETERVVVHDAARPFATVEMVAGVLERLKDFDGAICAMPVSETLKRAEGAVVVDTVDRAQLYLAQTPQAFRTKLLKDAHQVALQEGFDPTDDAQLIERCGGRIGLVQGSASNIKITYPKDFELAEAMVWASRQDA